MMNDTVARLMNLSPRAGLADNADRVLNACVVKPLGIIDGDQAREAVEGGLARWLAGGPLAFTAVAIVEGSVGEQEVEIRPVRDLARLRDRIISTRLEDLTGPRPPAGGLSWGRTRIVGMIDLSAETARDTKLAVARGLMMAREGADVVAIKMAAAPGMETERQRIVPVTKDLTNQGIRTAVFSRHAETMVDAAAAGARFLADIGGLQDDEMLHAVSGLSVPFIIRPRLEKPVALTSKTAVYAVHQGLEQAIEICQGAGISRHRLVVDPGVGALGDADSDLALLGGLASFHGLGCPMILGADRSGLIGAMTGEPDPQRRAPGDIVVAVQAMAQGVQMLVAEDVTVAWQAAIARRAVAVGQTGDTR